jgi:putative sigma-54 modulation protein
MEIAVRWKNTEVSEPLREYVARKLGKVTRLLDSVSSAQVSMSVEKERHIVEVTIPVGGLLLRAEEATGDMYASVDLVMEKLERQIRKHKTRLHRSRADATRGTAPRTGEVSSGPDDEQEPAIVKVKRFALKPMPAEEAALQMTLLGHDFFVFEDSETGRINVIYRRHDGNYGLIDPQPH